MNHLNMTQDGFLIVIHFIGLIIKKNIIVKMIIILRR